MWPSQKVAQVAPLDRARDSCDLLYYPGPAKRLLQELLQLPFRIKANVVIVHDSEATDWGETNGILLAILGMSRGSGFILLPSSIDAGLVINETVRELTHGLPIDSALGMALDHRALKTHGRDVIAAFNRRLGAFVLPKLVERYNARIDALPDGTRIDMSHVGPDNEWFTKGVEGLGIAGGTPKTDVPTLPRSADREVLAASVTILGDQLMFDHESQGATALAEVAVATAAASAPADAEAARAARFLQQQSFVRVGGKLEKAHAGFIAGEVALVRVRIAEPEEGWDSLPTVFPVEELPKHLERWNLTVWFSELDHLPAPLRGRLRLPRDGKSTECEFLFKPRAFPRFEGRIVVLHRGRIIQTAVLKAAVITGVATAPPDGRPRLEDLVPVRYRLGNLEERRQFDFAFVANHDSAGRPILTAVSDKAAWVKDLSQAREIAAAINLTLSAVAKSVKDYADGLKGEKGRKLLVQLAQHGSFLKIFLDMQLNAIGNNPATADEQYVQIVSTRPDSVVPLEFVYDYVTPEDGAMPCEHWETAVKVGRCPESCDRTSGKKLCPVGFWGLRKVIERHAVTPALAKDGNVLYLQSEPTRQSDTLHLGGLTIFATSSRVLDPMPAQLAQIIAECCGIAPKRATDWDEWEALVKEHRPRLLVALPHTDGKGTNVTVEIGNVSVKTITLRPTHVFPPPIEGRQAPLVALIGCDTSGTADDYGQHVLVLRARGAAIVIGTIATVFGEHAAKVAGMLVKGMRPRPDGQAIRLGELMLDVRRASLLDGLLMPLCLVAFGDADWKVSLAGGVQ
jgi:hypothetical protein